MWFLWALLWMRLAYYACHRVVAVSHRRLAILVASLVLGWWVYDSGFRYNDYQITAAVLCFPFYCIGAVAGRYRLGEASCPVRLVLVVVCLAAYVALFGHVGQIDISSLRFGGSYPAFIGIGTAAVVLWLLVLSLLPHPSRHTSWIVTLSSGTLVVLGFHIMLVQMFKLGYKHLLHITAAPPYMDTLGGVLIAAVIVAILYLPARYILRSGHGWLRLLAGR